MKRRGAAKGTGSGYRNLRGFPKDPLVHQQAGRGIKQPQLRTTLGGWHEIGHVKGTGALKKGEFVKSKFTGESGTVVGTSPFAVKYGQHVRYSNPKFWARGKLSIASRRVPDGWVFITYRDATGKKWSMNIPLQASRRLLSDIAKSRGEVIKVETSIEDKERYEQGLIDKYGFPIKQTGGKAAPAWSATTQKQLDDLRKNQDDMTTSDLQGAVMALSKDSAEQDRMLEYIYNKEKIVGGLGDNRPDSDFDPTELRKGMHVEEEHTRDTAIAKEIAKDHLTEDKDYYKKLAKMEGKKQAYKSEEDNYWEYHAKDPKAKARFIDDKRRGGKARKEASEDELYDYASRPQVVITDMNDLTDKQKSILSGLNYEYYPTYRRWSVKKGETQRVMIQSGLSRRKADALIMKVLNKLESDEVTQ